MIQALTEVSSETRGCGVRNCRRKSSFSEEPGHPKEEGDVVYARIRLMDSRAGIMRVPGLSCQRHVITQKPSNTGGGLRIKFEGAANIGRANSHGRHSRTPVHKRNPASPCGEVVTQMRRKTDEPAIDIVRRVILETSEELCPPFEVAAPPVITPNDSAQHVTIRSTQQREIVGLVAAKTGHADCRTGLERDILGRAKETVTDSVLPNRRFWGA